KAKIDTAKQTMRGVMEAIELHRINKGKLPDSLQELCDPDNGEIQSKEEPVDSWGNHFQYKRIDKRNYELVCLGADGVEGGDDEDADFNKDELNKQPEKDK